MEQSNTNNPSDEKLLRTEADDNAEVKADAAYDAGEWGKFNPAEVDPKAVAEINEIGRKALVGINAERPPQTIDEAVAAADPNRVGDSMNGLREMDPGERPPEPYPEHPEQ